MDVAEREEMNYNLNFRFLPGKAFLKLFTSLLLSIKNKGHANSFPAAKAKPS